jgi:hypothetical protein
LLFENPVEGLLTLVEGFVLLPLEKDGLLTLGVEREPLENDERELELEPPERELENPLPSVMPKGSRNARTTVMMYLVHVFICGFLV